MRRTAINTANVYSWLTIKRPSVLFTKLARTTITEPLIKSCRLIVGGVNSDTRRFEEAPTTNCSVCKSVSV